jgi:hypothetical protein
VTGLHLAPATPAAGSETTAPAPTRHAPAVPQAADALLPSGLWLGPVPATATQLPPVPPELFVVHLALAGGEWARAGSPVEPAALAAIVRRCQEWRERPVVLLPGRPPTGGAGDALPALLAGRLGVPVYVADGSTGLLPGRLATLGRFWRFDPTAVPGAAADAGDRLPGARRPSSPPRTAAANREGAAAEDQADRRVGAHLGRYEIPDLPTRQPAGRRHEPPPEASTAARMPDDGAAGDVADQGSNAPTPPAPPRVADTPRQAAGRWQVVTGSVAGDEDLLRARLDWRFGVAARAVTDVLAERPGLRRVVGVGDRHVHLIGLRAYLVNDRSAVDEMLRGEREAADDLLALARLAVSGLGLLPAAIGPALLTGPAPAGGVGAYRPGDVLVEPGFVGAQHADVTAATPPQQTIRYALLSSTGRQVRSLVPDGPTAVLFAAGTRWRVFDVDGPDEACAGTVYLGEVVGLRPRAPEVDHRALAALRAAAAAAQWLTVPVDDGDTPVAPPRPPIGLDRQGRPIADHTTPPSRSMP